jgi:hypothetical protein
MSHARPFRYAALFLFTFVLYCSCVSAQAPVDPAKLPNRTLFYLMWHGMPSVEVRNNNSLFALWNDPQFAAMRASFVDSVLTDSTKPKANTAPTRQEIDQYAGLLDNAFLLGYMRQQPQSHTFQNVSASQSASPPSWNGLYFIYDRSGKEELLSKAVTRMRTAETDIPKISDVTVAGVPSLKIERKSGITYWAEFGKYAVSANEAAVFEEVLNVVNGKYAGPTLSQSPAYQEAMPLLRSGLLEFFLVMPKVDDIMANSTSPTTAQLALVLSALKLESVHSIAGRVLLDGRKTRLTGAILGDTSPGGLFDIWPAGQSSPVSMLYLQPDTIGYGESEFNLLGIYELLKRAFAPSSVGSPQAATPLEKMAEARLGMPLPDALALLTGEIGWIQTSPTLDNSQKVYLLGINNQPSALKLTHTLFTDQISSEHTVGDTTFLKISTRQGQSSTSSPTSSSTSASATSPVTSIPSSHYLAFTPTVLLASEKSDTLQPYLSHAPASPDPVKFKNLLAARAQLPQKLNGFSYFDLQKLDWPGLRAKWLTEANQSSHSAKSASASSTQDKWANWLTQINPDVFSKYLHTMAGESWKDANGVHFEHWLD